MARRILAIVLGVVSGTVFIAIAESVGALIFTPPKGLDFNNRAAFEQWVATLPDSAFCFPLIGYIGGSFIGGVVATLLSGRERRQPALQVGALLTVAGIANLMSMPHPLWFALVSTLVYIPFALLGFRVALRPAVGGSAATAAASAATSTEANRPA